MLDQVSREIQRRKYSRNTDKACRYWIRQFILFSNKQHPETLSDKHIEKFLTYLVVERGVSGNTQSQALNAIAFLYKQVLKIAMGDLNHLRNFRRFKNLPTVLDKAEMARGFSYMRGKPKIMAGLLYGSEMRVNECVTLRVQDTKPSTKAICSRICSRKRKKASRC